LILACLLYLPVSAQDETAGDSGEVFDAGEITIAGTRTEKRLKDTPVVTEIITAGEIENSSAVLTSGFFPAYDDPDTGSVLEPQCYDLCGLRE
jgi:hypothetical protein